MHSYRDVPIDGLSYTMHLMWQLFLSLTSLGKKIVDFSHLLVEFQLPNFEELGYQTQMLSIK